MMATNTINDRFIKAFEEIEKAYKLAGKRLKKVDFASEMGMTSQTLSEILGKRQGVSTDIMKNLFSKYNVRYEFIFEGDYPIFKGEIPLVDEHEVHHVNEKELIYQVSKPISKNKNPLIPFYDLDFAAGSVAFYDDPTSSNYSYQLDIPEFSGCIGFRVYGDSMMPLISSGSMVFGTKIENWNEHLEYGRIYGIVCQDGHKFIKYIRRHPFKSEDRFILRSENNAYDDFDLEKSNIRNIWLIHGWVIKVV